MKTLLRHRQIDFFDKETEELIGEIDLPEFDIETIKNRFETSSDDPLIFNPYRIDSDKSDLFPNIDFDFQKFDYYLSCYGDFSIRTNKIMDSCLQKINYDFGDTSIDLSKKLNDLIASDFFVDNDCILLSNSQQDINPSFKSDFEKCDWEYNETHIHIDDYVDCENEIETLRIGLEYGKRIALKLANRFCNDKFRIIVSFSKTEKVNGAIETYGSCTVRFYKIRADSEDQMFIQNLDSYELDAILEFEKK